MYFKECNSSDELKKEYRRLSMELHPDKGGNSEEFQRMCDDYAKRTKELLSEAKSKKQREEFGKLVQLLMQFVEMKDPNLYMLIKNAIYSPLGAGLLQFAPKNVREFVSTLKFD